VPFALRTTPGLGAPAGLLKGAGVEISRAICESSSLAEIYKGVGVQFIPVEPISNGREMSERMGGGGKVRLGRTPL
jgi:hypothetical protein